MPIQNASGNEILLRKRRARYRAWHRGTREMDLILGPYADTHVAEMAELMLGRFEELLEEMDPDLLDSADKVLIVEIMNHQTARMSRS
jgi:antitoxin CptB